MPSKFGPRGVLRCKATDGDDATEDPRFGRVGKQTIEDTGALTKKRMETIDDETSDAAVVSFGGRRVPGDRSSFGSMRHACTSSRMCGPPCAVKAACPTTSTVTA
jgi:hypothetical protein